MRSILFTLYLVFYSGLLFSSEVDFRSPETQKLNTQKIYNSDDIESEQLEILEPMITLPSGSQNGMRKLVNLENSISPFDKLHVPSSLTDLINTSPSVSQNGQGGHFQNFSIRGVSRQRVKTLINDMRIVSDRRAGVSASFIEPLLIREAVVWHNPASTAFGSGALGGAVQIEAKDFSGPFAAAGYSSDGNENYQVLGAGQDNWSLGIARRSASNAKAAEGSELNSHFTQYSATIAGREEWQGLDMNFLAIPAIARDVGKSNIDFPLRTTNYPEEKHLLVKLGISSNAGWESNLYIHPNDLETEVHKRKKSLISVANEAFDFGGNWKFTKTIADITGQIGVDYFGRRDINVRERSQNLRNQSIEISHPLVDGEENEIGIFSSLSWTWGATEMQAGARFSYFDQAARHTETRSDIAWSGFMGVSHPFANSFEITADFATGFRFPSLSERFFSGTTGRGKVIGNPGLKNEQSINIDLGVSWQGPNLALASHIFYLNVQDYIERIELEDDLLTFVNLNNGRIMGLELEGNYDFNDQWNFTWTGHLLDGIDDQGSPLSDIPSNRLILGLNYKLAQWEAMVNLELRAHKEDPGNGEKEISSAQLLSAMIRYKPSQNIQLAINGKNLFNENYFNSADRKSAKAVGRSIGVDVSWQID